MELAIRFSKGARCAAPAILIALSIAGCAINPVSERPEVTLLSVEKERELGAEEARRIEAGMGLVTDASPLAYVQAVGGRVAEHSPRQDVPYTFQIVNQPEPNAFAVPGGHIYVSRGLLVLANSEDELAGVLGHEVAHVAARHTVRTVNVAVVTSPIRIATGIAGLATSIVAPRLGKGIAGIGETASDLILAPHSRSQEREADDVGEDLAARAGYDPQGLPAILKTLEREEALRRGGPARQSFFATHPATPERVRDTESRAAKVQRGPASPVVGTQAEFLARLDGLLVGPDPAEGVFLESRFLQPELGFTLRFPAGWRTRNTPRAVIGHTSDQEAALLLTVAGKGEDPMAVARATEKEAGVRLLEKAVTLEINGLKAVRSIAQVGSRRERTTLDLTWVAHGGVIYQLIGISPTSRFSAYGRLFEESAQSFRPMTPADRAQIREARLRIVRARAGESLADLAWRTESTWKAEEIAVANGLPEDARLAGGQPVKVPILEPYRERR
jgi:predicted Zn-dependent protease